jgi:hypothetical protein
MSDCAGERESSAAPRRAYADPRTWVDGSPLPAQLEGRVFIDRVLRHLRRVAPLAFACLLVLFVLIEASAVGALTPRAERPIASTGGPASARAPKVRTHIFLPSGKRVGYVKRERPRRWWASGGCNLVIQADRKGQYLVMEDFHPVATAKPRPLSNRRV